MRPQIVLRALNDTKSQFAAVTFDTGGRPGDWGELPGRTSTALQRMACAMGAILRLTAATRATAAATPTAALRDAHRTVTRARARARQFCSIL